MCVIVDNAVPKKRKPKATRATAVAVDLGAEIESGAIPLGAKLSEEALAERFGVSRGPVREALSILAREDLVRIRPHVGAFVPKLTMEEISDLYDVRAALFSATVRLFTKRHQNGLFSDEILNKFADLTRQIVESVDASSEVFSQHSQALSCFLIENCGNAKLCAEMLRINRQSYLYYIKLGHQDIEQRRKFLALGTLLCDAILLKEPELAASIGMKLIDENKRAICKQLLIAAGDPEKE